MNYTNLLIGSFIFLQNSKASIGRAIVYTDNFLYGLCLMQDAVEATAQIGFDIVDRHDNREWQLLIFQGLHLCAPLCFLAKQKHAIPAVPVLFL